MCVLMKQHTACTRVRAQKNSTATSDHLYNVNATNTRTLLIRSITSKAIHALKTLYLEKTTEDHRGEERFWRPRTSAFTSPSRLQNYSTDRASVIRDPIIPFIYLPTSPISPASHPPISSFRELPTYVCTRRVKPDSHRYPCCSPRTKADRRVS